MVTIKGLRNVGSHGILMLNMKSQPLPHTIDPLPND
jgi:hypothetical protein